MNILYLHGFRSAPASFKASLMADTLRQRGLDQVWQCPQLPASPKAAALMAHEIAVRLLSRQSQPADQTLTVIGSSLGGYYATWLAETLGCRAVLLNPAVHAARDLATQVGTHRQFHEDTPFVFLPEYVQELRDLWVPTLTRPERYFLIAATGDEVLDWQEMVERYPHSPQQIVQGSDHGLSDFAQWLPDVLRFAGIDSAPASDPPGRSQ